MMQSVMCELEAISERLVEERGRKLGLDELLGYVHAAVAAAPGELLSAGHPLAGLVADVALAEGRQSIGMAEPANAAIAAGVARMCRRLADDWGAWLGRRPMLVELLDVFASALAEGARRFVDVPAAARVTAIRATAERRASTASADVRPAPWRRLADGDLFAIPLRDIGYVLGHVLHADDAGAVVDIYGPPSAEPDPSADTPLLRGVTVARTRPQGGWRVCGYRPAAVPALAAS